MTKKINIKLTEDEPWVLFDFVHRFSDTEKLEIIDQAEERTLWNLCCILEKTLYQDNNLTYQDFITKCRERLRDKN